MGESTGDPKQSEYIKPTIDLVGELEPHLDEPFDGSPPAARPPGPDYTSLTANQLHTALQDAVGELRATMAQGFAASFVGVGSLIASKSPADEAADLLREADGLLADVASGKVSITESQAAEVAAQRDTVKGILDALGAKGAAPVPAPTKSEPPRASDPPKPAMPPLVGAGGPGAVMAPRGLSSAVIRYIVAGIVVALVAGVGIIGLGGGGAPAASAPAAASAPPASPANSAPAATTGASPAATQAAPTAAPSAAGGLIFAPFEIVGDEKVDKCEHRYTVRFTVQDSTSQTAPFVGKTAVFRLLDNEPDRTAVIGADGTFSAGVDEHFEKTGAGCFSHLQPKVLTVDGRAVFG